MTITEGVTFICSMLTTFSGVLFLDYPDYKRIIQFTEFLSAKYYCIQE